MAVFGQDAEQPPEVRHRGVLGFLGVGKPLWTNVRAEVQRLAQHPAQVRLRPGRPQAIRVQNLAGWPVGDAANLGRASDVDVIPAQGLVSQLHRFDDHLVGMLIAVELGAFFRLGVEPKRGGHGTCQHGDAILVGRCNRQDFERTTLVESKPFERFSLLTAQPVPSRTLGHGQRETWSMYVFWGQKRMGPKFGTTNATNAFSHTQTRTLTRVQPNGCKCTALDCRGSTRSIGTASDPSNG